MRWWVLLAALFSTASASAQEEALREEEEFSGPSRLDVGVRLGYGRRLDDPPFYSAAQSDGLVLGGEVLLFVVRRVALGLSTPCGCRAASIH
jgi:hypothetical protein